MSSRLRSRLRASTSLSGGGGPAAALDLNFITGSYQTSGGSYAFQDLIRFSRTTAGTFVGSNGLIQNSPISNNLMLWTEEAENAVWTKTAVAVQSNLLTYSEQFDNAAWTKGNATITANTTVAPDGLNTGDTITGVTAGVSNFIRPTTLPTAVAALYTFSIWVMAGTATTCSLIIRDNTGATNLAVTSQIVSGPGSISGSPIVNVTGLSTTEWTRVAITLAAPATAGNALQPTFYPETALSATTALSNIIWGAQFVQGALPANYQPTLASAVAIQYLAPNNVLSANKIIENSANTYHFVREPVTAANVAHTFTTYLKAGERTRAIVSMSDITTGDASIGVDLTNGTTFTATGLSIGSWTAVSSSVTSVGNGWYRVSVTATKGAGTQIAGSVFPTDGTSATFLGDGSSGFYMWGSQLEVGSSATAYSRNADGRYAPRFDYDPVTLAAKGLLIEEQRTNLLTYSEQFNNAAWTKLSMTVTADSVVAPDGQTTADTLTGTASSFCYVTQVTPTLTTGVNYTLSRYVKAGTINFCTLALHAQADVYFDLVNLTYNAVGTGFVSAAIVDVGNGWRRISATWTKDAGTTYQIYLALASSLSSQSGIPIGATLYSWGAQFEAGSFVTSYIPTVASTVTRAADIALVTGGAFTPWYNPLAGTLSADVIPQLSNVANQFIASLSDGTNINRASIFKTTGGIGGFRTTSNGTAANPIAPANALTGNVAHKIALAITTGTGNVMPAVDGALGTAATLSTMPTGVNTLRFGVNEAANADWLNGHTRCVRYFNTRLTNAELQTVTT